MAVLDEKLKAEWKSSLDSCASPWIAVGVAATGLPSDRMAGMAGLVDWRLHGQVSSLLARNKLSPGDFCLIPGGDLGPNFLIYHFSGDPDVKSFLTRLRLLHVRELCLASSSFPEDFCGKLKQTLKKEGITCTTLEPDR